MRKHLVIIVLLTIISSIFWAQNVLDCIPVVKTVNNQVNQVVVSANSGSAIIAWQDERTLGNNDIYAQRISDDGHMQWQQHLTGKLIISQANNQVNLSMVSDGAGGAIIAWQDDRNVNWDIYATRIDANGDIYPGWGGANGLLICNDTSDQSAPKLVSVGAAGAFITWSDARAISGGDYDIYAMRLHLDGTLSGDVNGTRLQLAADGLNQVNPDICIDGAGGAIIAYEQYSIATDYDIFAQRINSSCSNLWSGSGVPACIANNNQKNPKLTNDDVGSAIIVWEDNVNFTWDIYAQRVYADNIQWTANGIAVMAIALDQIHPVIVSAGQYGAIIVWEHYLSATDSNIYAQKVWGGAAGTSGSVQWAGGGVNSYVAVSTLHDSYQLHPQAVSDGAGGAIIVYETGENLATNGYDVYGNHLNSLGTPSNVGGYPICTWDTDQTYPMIAYSGTATDNAIYAWRDNRNEAAPIYDIYTLGVMETYTYTVASHDVTGLVAGDLSAEIYFNGAPFATPIYTGYVFGAPGNEPMLAGTYTVVHPTFGSWTPASYTITDINQNHSTDFLGIRYILNVTSTPTNQNIFLDTTNLGLPTDHSFYNKSVSVLVGNYTLQAAPAGFHWVPSNNTVVSGNFNVGNNYTYNIDFQLVADAVVHTYTVSSHDVTGLVAGDLSAEIYFNGAPFATPIYTGYVFGAPGNEPMLAGTYTVVHPTFGSWAPVSFTITDLNQDYSTDFLGIRYILNVTSPAIGQNIYRDTINLGFQTDYSFTNMDVSLLTGNYTLETPPAGFVWSPTSIDVEGTDFNAGNDYTHTITFVLIPDPTLPVELSSFTAFITSQYFVNLTWVSQSETGLLGYRMYRNDNMNQATAVSITPVLIPATNTSTSHSYSFVDTEVSIGNTYYYWLESIDMNNTSFHGPVSVVVEGEVPPVLPEYTSMGNAYPNPFRISSSTTINVSVKAGEQGKVKIYNVLGQTIRTFEVNEGLTPLTWNGCDNNGNLCSSGIYFYKLQTPSMNQTKKMVIVK